MQPAILPDQTHYRGDLWENVYHFGPVTDESGDPPDTPALSCRMQFRDTKGVLGYELSSIPGEGKGTITIVDSVNHEFDIPPQDLPLEAGLWEWDFEVFSTVDLTGLPSTYFAGKMTVTKDISHD